MRKEIVHNGPFVGFLKAILSDFRFWVSDMMYYHKYSLLGVFVSS
jgi:hypothetical protein